MHPENKKILNKQNVMAAQVAPAWMNANQAALLNQIVSVRLSGPSTVAHVPQPTGHLQWPPFTYVSFRLAANLPTTHPWGGYVSNDFLASAEAELVANGCPAQHAHSIAADMIRAHISHQYLLDRACLNLHELFFMAGVGPRTGEVFDAVCYHGYREAGDIGLAKAHDAVSARFGLQSAEAKATSTTFDTKWHRRGELAGFSRFVFCDLLAGARLPFLGPDGPYGVARLLPVYTNEDKCFSGIDLPISYY